MAIDHTTCTHPRTPSGRRACRAGRTAPVETAPRAPRATQKPVRIQPRRSGARVAATSSSCVQAALHTRGRCACGWESWEMAA